MPTKTFADYAYDKMLDLYNNHSHEVGSELKSLAPSKYKGYDVTSCIIYSVNALSYAFNKIGNPTAAHEVETLKNKSGVELAKLLVTKYGWSGIYINPDVYHPEDGDKEHPYTNWVTRKKCTYYDVPVSFAVTNYRTTSKTDPNFKKLVNRGETKVNLVDISALKKVKFGFGNSRGGMHTWLFSLGEVFEVHWDSIGSGLYEKSPLKSYAWLSGVIVVPPSVAASLKLTTVTCP